MFKTPLKIAFAITIGAFTFISCSEATLVEGSLQDVSIDAVDPDLLYDLVQVPDELLVIEDEADSNDNAIEKNAFDQGRFNIDLKFQVPVTPRQQEIFETAAARWERIIIADVPSINADLPSGFGFPDLEGPIDDIVIEVILFPIDGPFNILGFAGPRFVRFSDDLPVSGIMVFDTDDLDFLDSLDLFEDVIVHEMGHVLGVGTLWDFERSLLAGTPSEPYFAGRKANVFWNAEGGEFELPIENTGGQGTRFGHWRESALDNELMTGFLNLGENPLSRITAGSMRDLGYGSSTVGESYDLFRGTEGVDPNNPGGPGEPALNIAEMEVLLQPVGIVTKKKN